MSYTKAREAPLILVDPPPFHYEQVHYHSEDIPPIQQVQQLAHLLMDTSTQP